MDQSSLDDAHALISQLEHLSHASSTTTTASLPSPRQVLAMGSILFRVSQQQNHPNDLWFAHQHLVDSLPEEYWKWVMATLQKAAHRLATSADEHDLVTALQSLNGLLSHAPRLCQLTYSLEWITTLAAIYDKLVVKDATASNKDIVLSTLSSLLLDGLLLLPHQQPQTGAILEESLLEAIQAMEAESTDCLGDLQAWQSQKEPFRRTLESELKKLSSNDDESLQQREYILNMLESARQQTKASKPRAVVATPATNSTVSKKPAAAKPISAADELERRIQQVKQILPDFGEGFIETALSLHQGNVETTVSTLLSENLPSALRVLDPSLPRRRKERAQEEAQEAEQARKLVKERVALEQQQEEARYKALLYVQQKDEQQLLPPLHDEYDDDYDDQYDEIDVGLGGADDGMYDFEQVKLYNQLVRTEESEDSFWQNNRNTNRINNNVGKKKAEEEEEENEESTGNQSKYRGSDKIKGGRVIGPDGKVVRNSKPGRGGGAGRGGKTAGPNSSEGTPSGGPQPPNAGRGKPRTKPKAQNRVNRNRDKKAKAQGTFGAAN